jgi:hypothetical protein
MAEETRSLKSSIIGGLIGAVAAAVVGGIIALSTNFFSFAYDKAISTATDTILQNLTVVLRSGESTSSHDFLASCQDNEIAVGGYCVITSGDGYIQNQGQHEKDYFCTYSRRSDPQVNVEIKVACLGRR